MVINSVKKSKHNRVSDKSGFSSDRIKTKPMHQRVGITQRSAKKDAKIGSTTNFLLYLYTTGCSRSTPSNSGIWLQSQAGVVMTLQQFIFYTNTSMLFKPVVTSFAVLAEGLGLMETDFRPSPVQRFHSSDQRDHLPWLFLLVSLPQIRTGQAATQLLILKHTQRFKTKKM